MRRWEEEEESDIHVGDLGVGRVRIYKTRLNMTKVEVETNMVPQPKEILTTLLDSKTRSPQTNSDVSGLLDHTDSTKRD